MLLIGYGNPGRSDDGLGPQLAEAVSEWGLEGLETLWDYQLNIEHAADLAGADLALFVDAALEAPEPFGLSRLAPSDAAHFSTHAMPPAAVLETCRAVYGRTPPSFLLALRGDSFEMGEGLSQAAERRLEAALSFLRGVLQHPEPRAELEKRAGG
ncbi:hydrogenase maturation protease [bacterium]|nr:hydrogenase maturation protease [bacterium]